MKPYLLVIHNRLRFALLGMRSGVKAAPVELLSRDSRLVFHKNSRVTFGDRVVTDGRFVVIADDGAELTIGDRVYLNEDAMISCKGRITIGSGCKFGPNVKIFDNNHKFDAENGVSDAHSAGVIEIGSHSWIGANCVILKGARIGKNCVIGAGCVISGDVPDCSIVTQGRDLTIRPMEKRGS